MESALELFPLGKRARESSHSDMSRSLPFGLETMRRITPHFAAGFCDILFHDVKVQVGPQSEQTAKRFLGPILLFQEVREVQDFPLLFRRQFAQYCADSPGSAFRLDRIQSTEHSYVELKRHRIAELCSGEVTVSRVQQCIPFTADCG
jgi:hypothetical protein